MDNIINKLLPNVISGNIDGIWATLQQSPLVQSVKKAFMGTNGVPIASYNIDACRVEVAAFNGGIILKIWEVKAYGNILTVEIFTEPKTAYFWLDKIPF
jgi:hypothetical protein